jgi:hypothetical protein
MISTKFFIQNIHNRLAKYENLITRFFHPHLNSINFFVQILFF